MAKKLAGPARREGGLHLAIENEDWVAISGTPPEIEQLGKLLIEFARAEGRDVAIFDSPSPLLARTAWAFASTVPPSMNPLKSSPSTDFS